MMKRSPAEKAALRKSIRAMSPRAKASYLLGYYWWAFALGILAVSLLIGGIVKKCGEKETVLTVALVNVSVGADLEQQLTDGFLNEIGLSAKDNQLLFLSGFYMTDDASADDHEYAYASRMKLMAAITSKQLDVVLMNREAYDLFSANGYLLDLSGLDPQESGALAPYLTQNDVVLEDNATDLQLNLATEHRTVTQPCVNALDASALPVFQSAGFSDTVYLGIVASTEHRPDSLAYLNYLCH